MNENPTPVDDRLSPDQSGRRRSDPYGLELCRPDLGCNSFHAICIFTATGFEFNLTLRLLDRVKVSAQDGSRQGQGRCGANRVTVFQTGIGARQLDGIMEAFHATRPRFDLALVCGLAAGLAPSLRVGDLVFYDRCVLAQDQAREFYVAPEWLRAIHILLGRRETAFVSCTGLTVDRVLISASEKAVLGRRFNAQAADMESFQILEAMQMLSVPTLALRSISDEVDQPLPDFNRAINEHGELQAEGYLAFVLNKPFRTIRLARGARKAARSLQRGLQRILLNC